ncbi:MAG: carbohydrate kinase [Burkholderiaceae bacterium]
MFLVCGEALMDVYVRESTVTGLLLDARVGGSPFNVAVGLARLGQPVRLLSGLSRDAAGRRLMQALADERVDTSLVVRTAAPTTLGVVSVDADGVPSYAFHNRGTADLALSLETVPPIPADVRALQFGSYAMVIEPTGSTLQALAARQREHRLLAFDPNVRLNVEPDIGRWREVVDRMVRLAHLVKVSDEDLRLLDPGRSPDEMARAWLALGPEIVVVTRGETGSEAWTRRTHVTVPSQPVDVVDTVGAGDTFQAALLTWLAEHDALSAQGLASLGDDEIAAMLRFGARAASITCSRLGANLPRRHELMEEQR